MKAHPILTSNIAVADLLDQLDGKPGTRDQHIEAVEKGICEVFQSFREELTKIQSSLKDLLSQMEENEKKPSPAPGVLRTAIRAEGKTGIASGAVNDCLFQPGAQSPGR